MEAKYFEEDYRERITVSSILTGRFGELAAPAGDVIDRPRIRVTPTSGATVVRGGQHVRLSVEAVLGRGLHAYAPGAPPEFIPVSWTITPSSAWKTGEPEWPIAEKTQLYGVDEKVPNYSGTLRVSREVTLAAQPVLTKEAPSGELTVSGEFRYQACNDRVCFPPETVPLKWKLLIEGHDRERVPKELQRPGF
ncbi:MAG: protein-disulfide reductase DsbD domain-containing protein [Bryobacteraceae bacterium]